MQRTPTAGKPIRIVLKQAFPGGDFSVTSYNQQEGSLFVFTGVFGRLAPEFSCSSDYVRAGY